MATASGVFHPPTDECVVFFCTPRWVRIVAHVCPPFPSFPLLSLPPFPTLRHSVVKCWLEFRETGWYLVFLGGLLVFVLVVLQEEVVAGHGECPHQYNELCEVHLTVIVGV